MPESSQVPTRPLPEYVRIEDLLDRPGRPYVGISSWGFMDIYTADGDGRIYTWDDAAGDFRASCLDADLLAEMRYLPLGALATQGGTP